MSFEFNEGHRYQDFDSNIDKVAAVRVGGLIAGKVLAKAGISAKLGIFFARFWKFLLTRLAGAWTAFKKFFSKKEE